MDKKTDLLNISWEPKVIEQIVDKYLKEGNILPKWLAKAKPRDISVDLSDYDLKSLDERFGKEYLIAGGFITKKIYNKEWDSDIDIWLNDDTLFKDKNIDKNYKTTRTQIEDAVLMEGMIIDLIHNKFESFSDVISNFDLSCCQIGYERNTGNILVSRLFLYTLYTGKVIVMPKNIMIEYTVGSIDTYKKSMKELSKKIWKTEGKKKYDINTDNQIYRRNKYMKRGIGKTSAIVFLE